jgi:hypothetical protein
VSQFTHHDDFFCEPTAVTDQTPYVKIGRRHGASLSDIAGSNANAPTSMIGKKAAEMIAAEYGVGLREFVGEQFAGHH